jgi:PAS domain S-box-containing protein
MRPCELVYRSAELCRLLGFAPEKEAVPLEGFLNRVHPEDRRSTSEAVFKAVRAKSLVELEFRVALSDGTMKRVHTVGDPVLGRDGNMIEIIGRTVEVTDDFAANEARQKASDEVNESESHLRLVIDTVPAFVWCIGPDGAVNFFNRPCLEYTGLSMDQAVKWGWTGTIHPEDAERLMDTWRTAWTSGALYEAEARIRRFDGEYRWFLLQNQPLRDEAGSIAEWYGSGVDIEDRKRTEAALLESEQRFRDYAETASDWLWETGPDHRLTRSTDATDVAPSGVIGLAHWDIAADVASDPEKWRQHRATLDARLPYRDFVYRTADRNGSPTFVRTSGKPFFSVNGNFLGYRGVGTDITAAIRADQAEQALGKAQWELAHVTRVTTLGELTASIAHEISQPLGAVIANAEACLSWLTRGPPDLEAARRSVQWIIEDGKRASEVIRGIRALAKGAAIEKVPLDINNVVTEVMALVQRELDERQVSLQVELAPTIPRIMGDRIQLQQVIINLVMNAIEAMQSVMDRPRDLVIRSAQDEMGHLTLSVTDCGVGISAEDADRMFNPFFTTKSTGMGMGLSICRSIVEAHEGRLSAYRNEGPGATLQFILPSYRADASE